MQLFIGCNAISKTVIDTQVQQATQNNGNASKSCGTVASLMGKHSSLKHKSEVLAT
jgi:hypothetical protein